MWRDFSRFTARCEQDQFWLRSVSCGLSWGSWGGRTRGHWLMVKDTEPFPPPSCSKESISVAMASRGSGCCLAACRLSAARDNLLRGCDQLNGWIISSITNEWIGDSVPYKRHGGLSLSSFLVQSHICVQEHVVRLRCESTGLRTCFHKSFKPSVWWTWEEWKGA